MYSFNKNRTEKEEQRTHGKYRNKKYKHGRQTQSYQSYVKHK